MHYFQNPEGKAVKIAETKGKTTVTVSDSSGNQATTTDRPAAHYLARLSAAGYLPTSPEQYAALRASMKQEQKYHFAPECGRAIYESLAA